MFGKTLIIVNPTARSGKASEVAGNAMSALSSIMKSASPEEHGEFHYTIAPHDATDCIVKRGADFDTVLAIGGDGLIHEIANGLMLLPSSLRPTLGVIPCGNGDDFARSIGMDRNPRVSLKQITAAKPSPIDVGCVNGEFYLETLSFGLDAAIALQTMNLRRKTGRTGTSLYLQCGFDQLMHHLDAFPVEMTLDDRPPMNIETYMLAVQNGPSYGGGFKICPNARLDDGYLDICYATVPLSVLRATKLFLSAKNGKHGRHPNIAFEKARRLHLALKRPIAAQIDGEPLFDTNLDISLHPEELTVLKAL